MYAVLQPRKWPVLKTVQIIVPVYFETSLNCMKESLRIRYQIASIIRATACQTIFILALESSTDSTSFHIFLFTAGYLSWYKDI